MSWLPLNTVRKSSDAALLRDAFPLDSAIQTRMSGADDWIRQLDWVSRNESTDARAWLDFPSGSMVLIEAIGVDAYEQGFITARLKVGATGAIVDLVDHARTLYSDDDGRYSSFAAMSAKVQQHVAEISALELPS